MIKRKKRKKNLKEREKKVWVKMLTKENYKMNIKERKMYKRILNKVTKGGKEDNLIKKD